MKIKGNIVLFCVLAQLLRLSLHEGNFQQLAQEMRQYLKWKEHKT